MVMANSVFLLNYLSDNVRCADIKDAKAQKVKYLTNVYPFTLSSPYSIYENAWKDSHPSFVSPIFYWGLAVQNVLHHTDSA